MTKALMRTDGRALATTGDADELGGLSFQELVDVGDKLVSTGFLPQHIRNGVQLAAITLTGRELGMPMMRSVRSLQMVKGKVVEDAASQLARFKADGGHAQFKELTNERAVLWLRHPNGDEHVEEFTSEDAKKAGLAGDNWSKFRRAMLRSRAITAGLKGVGWEGAVGNYDPDEASRIDDAPPRAHERVTQARVVDVAANDDTPHHAPATPAPQLTAPATTVEREPGADDDAEPAPQQDGDPVAAAVAAIQQAPSQAAAFAAMKAARDTLPKDAQPALMAAFNARSKGAA